MLPVLSCFAVFLSWRGKTRPSLEGGQREVRASDDRRAFLLTMGFLPFGVTIALSVLGGTYIHSLWGMFYWNLSGILLFYFCRDAIDQKTLRRRLPVFFVVWGSFVFLTTVGFLSLPFVASPRQAWLFDGPYQAATKPVEERRTAVDALIGRSRSARQGRERSRNEGLLRGEPQIALPPSLRPYFDGKLLAEKVAEAWRQEGYPPLAVVGGGGLLAANVSFFAPSSPDIVTLFDDERTAWLARHQEEWREKGGVLLWFVRRAQKGELLEEVLSEGLPRWYRQALRDRPYMLQAPFVVPWRRIFGLEVGRVRGVPAPLIGWAIVPPLRKKSE